MLIRTNVEGRNRKRLVEELAEILDAPARYLGAPTMAYAVGEALVDLHGTVTLPDGAHEAVRMLAERGYEDAPQGAALTITLPRGEVDVDNMAALLAAKGRFIEHALGVEGLPMEVADESVSFPWFEGAPDADDAAAATALIAAMARMSMQQRRVTAKPADVENEKYAFRCFLLRLGFIGDDKKAERKALLRRLSGSSAFKAAKEGQR